jgi:hypothetical protein
MAGDEEEYELGPWKGDDLRATARAAFGIGADEGLPAEIRFRSNVAKLVRRRLATQKARPDPKSPAIFLLQPTPPLTGALPSPKRVPMLDNGLEPLAGRIWFVGANPGSGHFSRYRVQDDDALFELVTNHLKEGSTPAMIFDPRVSEPEVRYYPYGLTEPSRYERVPLSTRLLNVGEVIEVVDGTYNEKMVTYQAQPKAGKLWANNAKWWPHGEAEDRVQFYLEVALNSAFPTCTVRPQQDIPEGTLDIEIIENDPVDRSIITQHGILELKVLRSYWESGSKVTKTFTLKWIKSGVEQAAAYRDRKGARWAALLCFDMRELDVGEKASFSHVRKLAKTLDVDLRRWFLYATSKQLRTALAAAKSR